MAGDRLGAEPRWRRWLQWVAWLEPLWVLIAGGGLLLPARVISRAIPAAPPLGLWQPLLIGCLLAWWPIRALAYGRFTRRTPLDWPLLVVVLWLPVSLWASADKAASWEAIGYLVFGLALYFALLNWPPARRYPQIIAALPLAAGLGLAVVAPLLTPFTLAQFSRIPGLRSVLGGLAAQRLEDVNVNVLAGAIAIVLPAFLALAISPGDRPGRRRPVRQLCRVVALGAALMMFAVVLISQSRGAIVGAAAAVAAVVLLRWPRLVYALPVALLAGGIALFRGGVQATLEMISAGSALGGLSGRLEVWSRALYALNDFAITGIGFGTFRKVVPILYPYFAIAPDAQIHHAHNLFLQVGLDLGIPGLIAYVALLLNTFVFLGKALRRRDDPTRWGLAAGATAGLIALVVHGLFDAALWGARPAFLPWLLIALAMQLGLQAAEARLPRKRAPLP